MEKLGVRAYLTVSVVGPHLASFPEELRSRGADVSLSKPADASDLIFVAARNRRELLRVAKLVPFLAQNGAMWIVYPKGTPAVTEKNVREAGLAAGLVDNKVVSFSDTETALRFVIPAAKRSPAPEAQLKTFLSRYTPEMKRTAQQCLQKLRAILPGAVEMVYDNYNALVVGFGASAKASEAILSIGIYPKWINVYFVQGWRETPDPEERLQGSGSQVRWIRLESAATLDEPAVDELIRGVISHAEPPLNPARPARMVIKAIAAKQRPRIPSR